MRSFLDSFRVVLICENDPLTAVALEDHLAQHGVAVAGPWARSTDALHWLHERKPAAAILDVKLNDGLCFPIARRLRILTVPFFFFSAYDRCEFPAESKEFEEADWISKPFPLDVMVRAVEKILH